MTDKQQWLELWGLSGEEGERQWAAKQAMHNRRPVSHHVMPDIGGYKSMQTGEWIGGRRQHREHLKEHRLIEIGNEPIKEQKQSVYNSDEVKREIARHFY